MKARDEVLARIRAANVNAGVGLGGAVGGRRADGDVDIPRDYHHGGGPAPGSPPLLDLLRRRLIDYRASVVDAAPGDEPAAIRAALTAASVGPTPGSAEPPHGSAERSPGSAGPASGSVGRPGGAVLVPPGLPAGWCPDGVVDRGFTATELDGFAAVVTACAAACALTGTIALDGSPDQGRRAITLVPDVHVCVVRAAQVVHGVPDLLARLDPDPSDHAHQRPVGHQRHRVRPRRGRPRPPHPRRHPRRQPHQPHRPHGLTPHRAPALVGVPVGALSRAAAGVVAAGGVLREEIWERLARVPDPCSPRGRVYPLPCLLVVWLCALTGQVEVDQKSNETSAFQPLLRARLARLPWADVPTNLAPCAPR